jgi:hypothetical protein
MKLINLILLGSAVAMMSSCGNGEKEEKVEDVVFNADVKTSTIEWKGMENDQHFHVGTVMLKEGNLTMNGDQVVGGHFVVDMSTITAKTEGYPVEKLDYLNTHLKDTAFFFVAQHPDVTVDVTSYEKGKLKATFNILGASIEQEVPVKLTSDEKGATITGDFKLDISSVNIPYAKEINPETNKPALVPSLDFKINLVLKK